MSEKALGSRLRSPILDTVKLHREKMSVNQTVKQFYVGITDKAKKLQMGPQETLAVFVNGKKCYLFHFDISLRSIRHKYNPQSR